MQKWLSTTVAAVCLNAAFVMEAQAATRTVCASGCSYNSIQAAIDAASYGDVILLRAGETFVGHYILRAKSGTGWIEIRSDAPESDLPAAGTRLVPSDRGGSTPRTRLARIVGRGDRYKTSPLIKTEPGAHGYVIRFVEFDGEANLGYETLIQLGEDTTATPPYDITFDRVYIHGHAYKGQKRGVTLNGRRLSILNSYISDIKAVNTDSQAILGYNGAGPFTIENNYLEAAGENVMFGGANPAITNLVPSDILLRRNHIFKPLAWRNPIVPAPGGVRATAGSGGGLAAGSHYFKVVALMATGARTAVSVPSAEVSASVGSGGSVTVSWSRVAGADTYRVYRGTSAGGQRSYLETTSSSLVYGGSGETSGTPPSSGTKWTVKNILELKNAARVTVDGNILENSWSAGQAGYAIMLTPRNGNGSAPWTRVQDVTFTNNIVRHVAAVVNISGYDNTDTTQRTERITFRNNLFHDVDHRTYGTNAKALLLGDGAAYVVFDRNTIVHTNTAVLWAYGSRTMPGFVYTNNISLHNTYGIMGDSSSPGTPSITKYFPGGIVRCNVLAGGKASLYPTPNGFPSVADWNASFVSPAAADYRLRAGSPVALAGCSGEMPGADILAVNAAVAPGAPTQPAPAPAPSANEAPIAEAGGPYTTTVATLVSVDGTQSRDPEGSVLDYRWTWGDELLVRAADLPASALRGSEWVRRSSADAAGGAMIQNPDRGASKRSTPLASPASYVEVTVNAAAGVPYYFWMRLRAEGDHYASDSLYVQFSNAVTAGGSALARIGTTSALPVILEQGRGAGIAGWGWTDSAWEAAAAPIYFAQSGLQTIRIQAREDGVAWDQIVLSSGAHTSLPGATKNDATHVDADFGTSGGVSAAHRFSRAAVYPVLLRVTDAAGASATDTATVTVR